MHQDWRGLEGIRYLLIAGLVIIAAIGARKSLGGQIGTDVKDVVGAIDDTGTVSIAANGSADSAPTSPFASTTAPTATTGTPAPASNTPQMLTKSGRSTHQNGAIYCDYTITTSPDGETTIQVLRTPPKPAA